MVMKHKLLTCSSILLFLILILSYIFFKVGINIGESNYKVSFGGVYYYESMPDANWSQPLSGVVNRPNEYMKLQDANYWTFETFTEFDNVTRQNRTVIDSAKTDDHVYFRNEIRGEFDASTYEYFNPTYSKDVNGVYLYASDKIDVADQDTFEVIDFNTAKDQNNVFFQGEIVIGADAPSFRAIEGCSEIYKDKNRPYFRKFAIVVVTDVDSFDCVTEGYSLYFTDDNNVYLQDENVFFEPIASADRETFRAVSGCPGLYVDSNSVYVFSDIYSDVESPLDFTCVNGSTTDFTDGVDNYIYNDDTFSLERTNF